MVLKMALELSVLSQRHKRLSCCLWYFVKYVI